MWRMNFDLIAWRGWGQRSETSTKTSVTSDTACRIMDTELGDCMSRHTGNWVAACSAGTLLSGLAIWSLIRLLSLLFPPVVGPNGVVHSVGRDLPSGVYGAAIGLVLGGAQSLVACRTRRIWWMLGTAIAGLVGMPLALAVANAIPFHLGGYAVGVVVLGALVGLGQSTFARFDLRRTVRWATWNALSIPVSLLVAIACESVARVNVRMWSGLALVFAAYPILIGVILGLLTSAPIRSLNAAERPAVAS